MTEETDTIDQAIARGNNAVAAKVAGQEIPSGLVRDPIYTWVYLGGLGVYGLLIAFFLLQGDNMLWLMLILGASSPSDSIKTLAKDRRYEAVEDLSRESDHATKPGFLGAPNSEGELCRMALLASTAKDSRNIQKKLKKYEPLTIQRAAYLVEAIEYAERAATKLTKGKIAKQWKLLKATRAISEVCPIIDDLKQEAAMAPLSAVKARGLSSALKPGVTARQATCRCMNALRKVSQPLKSKKPFVIKARDQVSMSGCIAQRLEVARATQYVAPKRSRFSDEGRAKDVSDKSAWLPRVAKNRR